MTISFNNLKNFIQTKSRGKQKKDDLYINLILITNRSKILSFAIVKHPMPDIKYLRIVKRLLKNT